MIISFYRENGRIEKSDGIDLAARFINPLLTFISKNMLDTLRLK
jgi:hypothetical protein